jgi:calcineurin-like phosphoesterase family protein
MRRLPILCLTALATGLALPTAVTTQSASSSDAQRIVAIGDIHGAADAFVGILRTAGLTDERDQWIGGRAHLIQTGDYFDRGEGVRRVLDLLMRLEEDAPKAGGRADPLMGNHEAMNLLSLFRDVSPKAFASFADDKSEERRQRAYDEYVGVIKKRTGATVSSREEWMTAHPPGFVEYAEALSPRGRYGRWLRSRNVVIKDGDTIFMHAGIAPGSAASIDDVNKKVSREVEQWDQLRETLTRTGLIRQFFTFEETIDAISAELSRIAAAIEAKQQPGDHVTREFVQRLQAAGELGNSAMMNPQGPLWFRGYAQLPESEEAQVTGLLKQLGAERFVTAHTPQLPGRITPRFNNHVFLIDTGMLTSYFKSGRPSALELQGGRITAIYADAREVLVGAGY